MAYESDNAHKHSGYEVAQQNHVRFSRARDAGHKDFVTEASKYEAFYEGDQWDKADKRKLDSDGRPAVTVNLVLPTINTITGEFSNLAADIQYKPKRGKATHEIAQSLTKLAMHICDANGYNEGLEKDMVEDALITGRGFVDARIDFSDNVLGEVRLTPLDPREVIPDPSAREYDPATWNEVFTTRWLSLDEIAVIYGEDKAEELRFYSSARALLDDDTLQWTAHHTYGDVKAFEVGALHDVDSQRTIKAIRVVERQYYMLAKVKEFVDTVNGDTRPVPASWDDAKIQLYAEAKQLEMRTRLTRRVRWTTSADCVLLHDEWSPYPTFTVIPLFCYFRRGKPFGVVKNLISPQEIVNKTESQMLHVVNTTANSGWLVETGALTNMSIDELVERGAQTGLVIEHARGTTIEKIHPNAVPSGLDNISSRSIGMVREISGVNGAMLGVEGAEVSGVALQANTMRGSIQLQTIRDNLKRTRRLLANKIVELVQRFYSEERVFYLTNHDGETEEFVVNARDAAGQIANDLTIGEYDVVVSTQPARDNFEDSQFAQALQLREVGIMVPDHRVIQYSGLHRKYELMDEVKQLTGFGDPTPEQQQMQQIQMQMLQLQVEKLTADVQATVAKAALSQAKAETEAQKPALEREQMQSDMAITAEEQSVRMQVQRLKEMSSQLQRIMDANVKVHATRSRSQEKAEKQAESYAPPRKNPYGTNAKPQRR